MMKFKIKRIIIFLIPILFVVLLWEIICKLQLVNASLFPSPLSVFQSMKKLFMDGTIISDSEASLLRVLISLLFGSFLGILVGLFTGRFKLFSLIFSPIGQILRQFPPVAIIPFTIVWFGIDEGAKIFATSFAVFFPIWISTYTGVINIPHIYLSSASQFTKSQITIFTKIILPGALPFIISGIRTSISVAFVMIFVSELAGASSGLGYRISISQSSYRIDDMMAMLIVLGILGASFDYLFLKITTKIFPWINQK